MNEIMLQGRGICKSYGSKRNRRQVLFDVDIEVRSGECLAIIGASGSGKSTLTRVLFGLESADCGEIAYRGQAMGERNDAVRHMLRGETGLVFQDPFASLDPRWRGRCADRASITTGRTRPGGIRRTVPHGSIRRAGATCRHCTCHSGRSGRHSCRRADERHRCGRACTDP